MQTNEQTYGQTTAHLHLPHSKHAHMLKHALKKVNISTYTFEILQAFYQLIGLMQIWCFPFLFRREPFINTKSPKNVENVM